MKCDRILIRANDKLRGLTNGQVLTISGIASDGELETKERIRVPAEFRQWCHGYVVTSRKAQGSTADHVRSCGTPHVQRSLHVACSRGRHSCIIHTPDKARLMERLPEGNRRAAFDVLSGTRTTNAVFLNRISAWKKLAPQMAKQAVGKRNQGLADEAKIAQSHQRIDT